MSLLTTTTPAIDLHGNGLVSKALQARLADHRLHLRTIHDSRGLVRNDGAPGPGIFVDCTPGHYEGEAAAAWITRLEQTLQAGHTIVTANKAPLALAWDRLHKAGTILHAATVGGGTGIIPWLQRLAGSQHITAIEGSLSGTLDFVYRHLDRGTSLDVAIRAAQECGFAEPDPRLDLDGTDALAKAIILHQHVFGKAPALADLPRLQITPRPGSGERAVLRITPGHISWRVAPAPWLPEGRGMAAVRVETDIAKHVISGPGAGADVTAANLLADILSVGTPGAGPVGSS